MVVCQEVIQQGAVNTTTESTLQPEKAEVSKEEDEGVQFGEL